MIDYLKSMAVFASVVEEGSFRKAAVKLSLSPSVISDHINKLEAHIGMPLLYRSTRKLSLTTDGKRFYPYCQKISSHASTALNEIMAISDEPCGSLHITFPAVLISTEMPALISKFCHKYPKIKLKVDFDNQRRNLIEEGFDLCVRIGWLEDSNLRATKIADVKCIICAGKEYIASHKPIKKPHDLVSHFWLKTEVTKNYIELFEKNLKPSDRIFERFPVTNFLEIKGGNIMTEMLKTNIGIAVIPEFLVKKELAKGTLVQVLPKWNSKTAGFYFVWADSGTRNPLVQYFIDFIKPNIIKWLE